jgi:hypothetical protein
MDDETFLDHHIEEMLRTFGDTVRRCESDLGTEEEGFE